MDVPVRRLAARLSPCARGKCLDKLCELTSESASALTSGHSVCGMEMTACPAAGRELDHRRRGQGAQINDHRIRVSSTDSMAYALLGTGFPYKDTRNLALWTDCFHKLMPSVSGVRRAGSAALDLAYVAAGRLDGFWEFDLNAWDIAAGCLLIQEAGGMVSEVDGGRAFLESGDVLAGNSAVYRVMLRQLAPIVHKYAAMEEKTAG